MASDVFFNNLPDFEKEAEEEKKRRLMPKAPSFSLDDMEAAREAAFKKGHEEGLQKAKDSIEQQTEILVQSLGHQINQLERAEIERHDMAIQNAITMTQKSVERLLPELLSQNSMGLIKESLSRFFADNTPSEAMTLHVHPDMIKPIEPHVKNLSPSITIKQDDTLSKVQARLTWEQGDYHFKPDDMINDILSIIQSELPKSDELLDDSAKKPHNDTDNQDNQDTIENE